MRLGKVAKDRQAASESALGLDKAGVPCEFGRLNRKANDRFATTAAAATTMAKVPSPPFSTLELFPLAYIALLSDCDQRRKLGVECRGVQDRTLRRFGHDFGHPYSPVRRICAHPRGEVCARRLVGQSNPSLFRWWTAWPRWLVFQEMMMGASRLRPAMGKWWPS